MKKMRIILSMTALMLAIGGVFASNLIVSEPGYLWNPTTGVCDQIKMCDGGEAFCESDDNQQLFRKEEKTGTCVTNALRHTP